jgi:hypothetical protein
MSVVVSDTTSSGLHFYLQYTSKHHFWGNLSLH